MGNDLCVVPFSCIGCSMQATPYISLGVIRELPVKIQASLETKTMI